MAADLELALAKPRDHVETPSGRIGIVTAVLTDGRREVKYLDGDRTSVVLHTSLLRVRVNSTPRPWRERGVP